MTEKREWKTPQKEERTTCRRKQTRCRGRNKFVIPKSCVTLEKIVCVCVRVCERETVRVWKMRTTHLLRSDCDKRSSSALQKLQKLRELLLPQHHYRSLGLCPRSELRSD